MSEVALHHFKFNQAIFVRDASPRLTADAGALLLSELYQKLAVTQHLAAQLLITSGIFRSFEKADNVRKIAHI